MNSWLRAPACLRRGIRANDSHLYPQYVLSVIHWHGVCAIIVAAIRIMTANFLVPVLYFLYGLTVLRLTNFVLHYQCQTGDCLPRYRGSQTLKVWMPC